jgi:hypothetical protein
MAGTRMSSGSLAIFLGALATCALAIGAAWVIANAGARPAGPTGIGSTADTAPNDVIVMGGVARMPAGADCRACHISTAGTVAATSIPALAHPLEGWTSCTACHAPERLVPTAPGHSGIHATECLYCHRDSSPAAPPRPHTALQTTGCLTCHGSSAPLPASMSTRSETTCWLCHQTRQSAATAPRIQVGDLAVVTVR